LRRDAHARTIACMRVIFAGLLLAAGIASAGELPGGRPRGSSDQVPVLRIRTVAELMLTDTLDVKKLGAALAAAEVRRTQDNSPMRPNEQVYFATTEQFQSVRLSIERDSRAANSTPHSLHLTPTPLADITLSQLDQTFGAGRPTLGSGLGPGAHVRDWIYGPLDRRFVAHIIGEFTEPPVANTRPVRLQIRIDRR
jgi:hypothetical protein